jgi:hypothetical protein
MKYHCYFCNTNFDHASFYALKLDGSVGGVGSIDISCLAHELDPAWIKAKDEHDTKIQKVVDKSNRFRAKLEAKKNELVNLYNIKLEDVDYIFQTLRDMYDDYTY